MKMLEPLPAEEQISLLRVFFDTRDPSVKGVLVGRNMRLVGSVVSTKFSIPPEDTDDIIHIGSVGLIKAVDKFDPNRKVKFATFATTCIRNEIRMHFRKGKNDPLRSASSLDETRSLDDEGGETCRYDTIPSDEDIENETLDNIMKKANIKTLSRLIGRCLDDREKFILIHRYGLMGHDKKTQKIVADMLGVSQSYVCRLERGMRSKLKKAAKSPS